jgi:hypothetical protein
MGEKMMEREGEALYSVAMWDTVILYDTLLYGIILPQDGLTGASTGVGNNSSGYFHGENARACTDNANRDGSRYDARQEFNRELTDTCS